MVPPRHMSRNVTAIVQLDVPTTDLRMYGNKPYIWQSLGVAAFRVHQTSRSRPGRLFEAVQEASLYPAALDAARSLPGASAGILVVPEMFGPLGVPDFLVMVGGDKVLNARLSSGIPPILSELDCSVIASLYSARPRSATAVADSLGWTVDNVAVRLQQLKKTGAVSETPSGRFLRHSSLSSGGTLYAIEVKVRDWPQAVRQSRGYRTWANNYVVVLGPIGEQARSSVTAEVEADGAGLFIDGKWIRKPSRRLPEPLRSLMGFEHLVASLEGYQPSPAIN